MDVFSDLIRLAEINRIKIFFFGTTSETLDKIKNRINNEYPNVDIVGLLSPPFEKSLDDDSYINSINNSGAGLLFVALGCPKQETWMASHSAKINATLLGVGAAFSIYAGTTKRAPLLLRNMGLEWFFRLLQEPDRLFMRYLTTNSMFIYLALKIKIKNLLNINQN